MKVSYLHISVSLAPNHLGYTLISVHTYPYWHQVIILVEGSEEAVENNCQKCIQKCQNPNSNKKSGI